MSWSSTNTSLDRTQLALSTDSGKLSYYQDKLRDIAEDLGRIVNVHVARRVEDNHHVIVHGLEDNRTEVLGALDKINKKLTLSNPSTAKPSQSIFPPPPTEMFTGRDHYFQVMRSSFQFSKTSVEMSKQRKFVLYGTGGMGKTQVALRFVDENHER